MAREDRLPLIRLAARARLIVKSKLGWVGGFPLAVDRAGVRWHPPPSRPAPEVAVLTQRELSHAGRGWTQLRTEYRETLPELFADPQAWLAAVARLLELLGAAVHRRAELPTSLWPERAAADAAALRSRFPGLAPLLDAASWSLAATPGEQRPVLGWFRRQADLLEALLARHGGPRTISVALELARGAARDGVRDARSLLAALADDRLGLPTDPKVASRHLAALRPVKKKGRYRAPDEIPGVPVGPGFSEVLDLATAWSTWDVPRRRRTARLWAAVLDLDALAPWQRWWSAIEREELRIRGCARSVDRRSASPQLAKVGARLERLGGGKKASLPSSYDVAALARAVRHWSSPERKQLTTALLRALRALPRRWRDIPAPAVFLLHWTELSHEHEPKRLLRHLAGFRRLVAAGREAALAPWSTVLEAGRTGTVTWDTIDQRLLDEGRSDFDLGETRSIHAARAADGLSPAAAQLVFVLGAAGTAPETAREAVVSLPRRTSSLLDFETGALAAAVRLTSGAEQLARVLDRLCDLGEGDRAQVALEAAAELVERHPEIVRSVLETEPARLADLGRRQRTLRALGEPAEPWESGTGDADRAWIGADFPPELRAALGDLADVDPQAEATARRKLRRDLRDRASLRRELAALRRKGDAEPGIRRRRRSLEQRLTEDRPLAPRVAARLEAKIRRAVVQVWLERLRDHLDRRLAAALARRFAAVGSVDSLLAGGMDLLDAVLAVEERPARKLGLELLAKRCAPPPWDLREAPANAAFLDRMKRRGVDLRPWLDEPFRQEVRGANGRAVTVALAADPLDVLRMGAHFGTCLSPGSFNFFSAVANAADVNKQVAYARGARGRVVGRCLLALCESASGRPALLGFHPYCHDPGLGFVAIIKSFVSDLARAMGIEPVPSGEVARLVSPEWYDDGPWDLRGDLDFLQEGRPFRRALADLEGAELPAALAAASAGERIGEWVVTSLLHLPELRRRPELVVPLAPWIERLPLPPADTLHAASLAREAGERELAARWVRRFAAHAHRADVLRWESSLAAEVVADLEPSLALRLLRQSRPRGVRRWADESDPYRLWTAARAHVALRRPRQAAKLYRRAAGITWADTELRRQARRAAARLANKP